MIKKRIKIAIIMFVIAILGLGIFTVSKVIVNNGYSSEELVSNEEDVKAPEDTSSTTNEDANEDKVYYNTSSVDTDKENYISKNSSSDEEVSNTNSILDYIASVYENKFSSLSSSNTGDASNTLLVQYKEDIDFSTVLSEYDYVAIIYGANIVDFLDNNCVVYSYKPEDDKQQYIVYDYSELNSFETSSSIGQEDSLNITCGASTYENHDGVDIIYSKGVKIQ